MAWIYDPPMKIITIMLAAALLPADTPGGCGWKGIVPLRSNRQDVERILGAPPESCKEGCYYKSKTERVFVRYSVQSCPEGEATPLKVAPGTVISVTVYLTSKLPLRDLKLDMRKFKRTMDPELNGYSTYTDDQAGVTYEVSDKNLILSIEWFGSAADIQALKCALGS